MNKDQKDQEQIKLSDDEVVAYPIEVIRGLPFPKPFLNVEGVEKLLDWKPDSTDIFVVTYPKCGTTWTQYLVWLIINKGAPPPSPNKMMFKDFKFLEIMGIDDLDIMPRPRTMKTHLPFNLQPYHPLAKYVYVVRNPWDCCVSYYYHHKIDITLPSIDFDRHFELFIDGQVGWGDFFDHVLSWYEHRNDPNVLFLTYEDMKRDPRSALFTIAKFLGNEYSDALKDETIVENCLKYSNFKYLKEMGIYFPTSETYTKCMADNDPTNAAKKIVSEMAEVDKKNVDLNTFHEFDFFRKGVIGDWRNHFTLNQIKKFNEYMIRKLSDTQMKGFWEPLMEETSV